MLEVLEALDVLDAASELDGKASALAEFDELSLVSRFAVLATMLDVVFAVFAESAELTCDVAVHPARAPNASVALNTMGNPYLLMVVVLSVAPICMHLMRQS